MCLCSSGKKMSELFFADDLVIVAETLEECVAKVKVWKNGMEARILE